jgi:hypothetical protein
MPLLGALACCVLLQVAEAFSTMGLHKGVKFHTWLSRVMRDEGVEKTSQLLDRMKLSANGITLYRAVEQDGSLVYQPIDMASLEPWIPSPGRKEDREQIPLRIVASEVVTQTKAVFPRDADLYYVRGWWLLLSSSAAQQQCCCRPECGLQS